MMTLGQAFPRVDSSVFLMSPHDLNELGSLVLIQITPDKNKLIFRDCKCFHTVLYFAESLCKCMYQYLGL